MQLLVVTWTGQQQHKGSWQPSRAGRGSSGVGSQPFSTVPTETPWSQPSPLGHQGLSRTKHIQGQLWSWSLIQKLSAPTFLCKEEVSGFSAWLHSLLWADRGWQNPIILLGKSPFSFSACLQLPHLSHGAASGIQAPSPYPRSKQALDHGCGLRVGTTPTQSHRAKGSTALPPSSVSWAGVCNLQLSSLAFVK